MKVRCRRFALPLVAALATAWIPGCVDHASAVERIPRLAQVGNASWYGPEFHGRLTASGARFDQNKMTAAHRTLPLNTPVRVTNLENNKAIVVVVNDRGPYVKGRVLDLSKAAAKALDMVDDGVVRVKIEPLAKPGAKPSTAPEAPAQVASN
jgi:rare lipoprotein A